MQRDDQWILLISGNFGRDEHRVRKLFVGVLEDVGALLNPWIDCSTPAAALGAGSRRSGRRLLGRLLRELNLCR